ncbi:GNAT family N-acetyltransferase [Candidatus Latescibacterota bacterium]
MADDFLQTPGWAKLLASLGTAKGYWAIGFVGPQAISPFLLVESAIHRGLGANLPAGRLWVRCLRKLVPRTEMLGAPGIWDGSLCGGELADMIGACAEISRSRGALRFSGSLVHSVPWAAQDEVAARLRESGFATAPWGTYRVAIQPDLEAMRGALPKNTRKALRRAERAGLTAREVGPADMDEYTTVWVEARERDGLSLGASPLGSWNVCERVVPGVYHRYAAFHPDGELLGGGGIYAHGQTGTSISVFQGKRARDERLQTQYLLHWHIMCWLAERGFAWYDLAGVDPNPAVGSKAEGIREFKSRWGGEYLEYVTFHRELPGFRSLLLRVCRRWLAR